MDEASVWDGNWAWSLPLILVTVILPVIGLVLINQRVIRAKRFLRNGRGFLPAFSLILGSTYGHEHSAAKPRPAGLGGERPFVLECQL